MSSVYSPMHVGLKQLGMSNIRVLAVDPGYDRLGLAVIEGDPSRPTHVWSTCVQPPKGAREMRLAAVYAAVEQAITEHSPALVALESLFFTKNQSTGIGVAEARGAVLAAAGRAGLSAHEFSPQAVKLAVTGYGNADKAAVMNMVPRLITLPEKKRLDDEFDAIALGIAALSTRLI